MFSILRLEPHLSFKDGGTSSSSSPSRTLRGQPLLQPLPSLRTLQPHASPCWLPPPSAWLLCDRLLWASAVSSERPSPTLPVAPLVLRLHPISFLRGVYCHVVTCLFPGSLLSCPFFSRRSIHREGRTLALCTVVSQPLRDTASLTQNRGSVNICRTNERMNECPQPIRRCLITEVLLSSSKAPTVQHHARGE